MSFFHISVKGEPDWSIDNEKCDQMLRNKDPNVNVAGAKVSGGKNIKDLHGTSSVVTNVNMGKAGAESTLKEPVQAELSEDSSRGSLAGYQRRERDSNFTARDINIFRSLIDKYSETLFNRKTDTASNLNKKKCWVKIEAEFNTLTENKRTLRQLQAKFDNLKRRSKIVKEVVAINNDAKVASSPVASPRSVTPAPAPSEKPPSLDGFAGNGAFNIVEVQIAEEMESTAEFEEPHSTAPAMDPIPVECALLICVRWACPECGKPSWSPAHLRIHLRVHSGERPACCHLCGARFRTDGNLARHLRAHKGEKPFACEHCDKRFTQKSVLIKHIRIHTGETPYACNICHKQFSRSFTLACHRRLHGDVKEEPPVRQAPPPPEKWTCDVCNKTFKNKSYKHAHMLIHTRTKDYQCQLCEKMFASEDSLVKHVIVHNQVQCSVCEKKFKTQANLTRHMLVHTGERPFPCNYCSKRFTQKSVLIKHQRIHTGEMPYQCEICLKKFSRSFTLENHLKRIHKREKVEKIKGEPTESKKNTCIVKEENLVTESVTLNIETPECDMKPFWCENCDNWYNNKEFYLHECGPTNKWDLSDVCEDYASETDCNNHDENERTLSPFLDLKDDRIEQIELDNTFKEHNRDNSINSLLYNTTNKEESYFTINTDTDSLRNNEKPKQADSNEINPKVRKKWACKLCAISFKKKALYQKHMKTHNTKGYCEICKKNFNSKGNLIRHMLMHSGEKPYPCEYCNKRFTQKSVLIKHERIHTGEMPYTCNVCNQKFARSFTLQNHKKVHSTVKPYSCQYCPKAFTQRSALTIHERNHTGEKPFSCKICNKHFTSNSTLINHNKIHNGIKPFLCEICNRQFTTSSNFYSHMRIHKGDKRHTCEVCQKKFYTNSSLTKHKRVHTNKVCKVESVPDDPTKPYGCSICRRRFANVYLLERHARAHSGEKPYECDECHMKFGLSGDLNRHRRTHTGEKRYSCAICNKQFTRSGTLKHHQKLHETTQAVGPT